MDLLFNFALKEQRNISEFIDYWSCRYHYSFETLYNDNIGKQITKESLHQLFIWKNGRTLSSKKCKSIEENYLIKFDGSLEERYLDHKKPGGAIWNVFYLHCLEPDKWPIFDQHTYRSMKYMKEGIVVEIPNDDAKKYEIYTNEYVEFFNSICINYKGEKRNVDKALFLFGRYLKVIKEFA